VRKLAGLGSAGGAFRVSLRVLRMSARVMKAIWLGCVLAGASLNSGVLAGDDLTGDRAVRSPTICPSGIFIDPATLPITDIPTQPGSIQTQRGEVLYSRADPAIQTLLTPQCEQEVTNCQRDARGYCKTPMIDPRLSSEMSNRPAATEAPSSGSVPVPVSRPRIIE
jgi:hypothetical protein